MHWHPDTKMLLSPATRSKNMLKVAKFGGSSLSDSAQFAKVKHIVESDDARKVVVVSAPGRRTSDDNKITDLLYLCKAHLKYDVSPDPIFEMISARYRENPESAGTDAGRGFRACGNPKQDDEKHVRGLFGFSR